MRGTGPIKSKWVCLYFFMYWDADAAVLCFGLVPYRTCLWEGAFTRPLFPILLVVVCNFI
jgi:hypothetical protein